MPVRFDEDFRWTLLSVTVWVFGIFVGILFVAGILDALEWVIWK